MAFKNVVLWYAKLFIIAVELMHMCLVYFPKHFIIEFVLLNDNKIE